MGKFDKLCVSADDSIDSVMSSGSGLVWHSTGKTLLPFAYQVNCKELASKLNAAGLRNRSDQLSSVTKVDHDVLGIIGTAVSLIL